MTSPDGRKVLRIGPQSVVYSRRAPYPGWTESFGNELSEAISSLEKTQENAGSAAQALATGTAKNPESAVTTVEDAQLAMQFAAQLRSKATETVQSVFQTQV